jgi:hypothetical protein
VEPIIATTATIMARIPFSSRQSQSAYLASQSEHFQNLNTSPPRDGQFSSANVAEFSPMNSRAEQRRYQ